MSSPTVDYAAAHAAIAALRRQTQPLLDALVSKPDQVLQIPSREPGRTIKAHLYLPSQTTIPGPPLPVLINLHGSGFVVSAHGSNDEFCRQVADEAGYAVVDVQYRLAPEDPFPCALEDVGDVVTWACSQTQNDGGHQQQLVFDTANSLYLSGFSAGGNLALAVSCTSTFPHPIRGVFAFYPSVDLATPRADKIAPEPSNSIMPSSEVQEQYLHCYLPTRPQPNDRRDPRISPLHASATAFPATVFIFTGAQDSLCLEAEALATKIQKEGDSARQTTVVCKRFDRCGHGFDSGTKPGSVQEQAKNEAYGMVVQSLRSLRK